LEEDEDMTLQQLLKHLEKNKQDFLKKEVEFVICEKATGQIISMELEMNAKALKKP
jgi:hypothetical protein